MAPNTNADPSGPAALDAAQFESLYRRIKRQARWGSSDRRGALNNLTAGQVVAAAPEVRTGRTVSLAKPVETEPSVENPEPCQHQMTSGVVGSVPPTGLAFAADRFAMNVHGDADSHLDALCHVIYNAKLYNDVPAATVTATGPTALAVDLDTTGIVGRGVLLDIPRARGVAWLEPGDHVTADDLVAAETAAGVTVGQGDLVFVRVGHSRRRLELGPWDAAESRCGLHPTTVELLAERRVAVLGSDGNSDTAPSSTEGVAFPVHVLAINALGLQLLDYLQFEDLVQVCEEESRWSFFCVIAPIRLLATGSPVNPIAIF